MGLPHVVCIFAEEDRSGLGEAGWPLLGGLDAAEASGKPLEGSI